MKKALDLTKVPDEDLTREYMRRLNERRRRVPGGLKVMRPCEYCKKEFSAREMRVHVRTCKQALAPTTYTFPPEAMRILSPSYRKAEAKVKRAEKQTRKAVR